MAWFQFPSWPKRANDDREGPASKTSKAQEQLDLPAHGQSKSFVSVVASALSHHGAVVSAGTYLPGCLGRREKRCWDGRNLIHQQAWFQNTVFAHPPVSG